MRAAAGAHFSALDLDDAHIAAQLFVFLAQGQFGKLGSIDRKDAHRAIRPDHFIRKGFPLRDLFVGQHAV